MNRSPLTLEALEVIDEIERRGSFASAALHLNRVPSALSYVVQRLEDQLGIALFQRRGRRSVLTPAGRHLLEEGRVLLQAAQRLADQTREIAVGWEPRIRIAIDTVVDVSALTNVLATFLQLHPQVQLDVAEEALGGTWEALTDDRADLLIGVGAPVPVHQGVRAEVMGSLQMIFAVAADHPLAGCSGPLTGEDLGRHRWVVVRDSSRFSAPRDTGRINSDSRLYVRTIEQKIAFQKAGLGVGYLPRARIIEELREGSLVELEVADRVEGSSDMLVAWKSVNRGKGLSALVATLLASGV